MLKFSALALIACATGASAFTPTVLSTTRRSGVLGAVCAERSEVLRPFEDRRALKIISGLKNFDKDSVSSVVQAANAGGATLVDIACDAELVKIAKNLGPVPVCVSAVEPELFVDAVKAGADMVEIGNYDGFYAEGRVFSAEEVLQLTKETRALLGASIPLSVTVPHTLPLDEQVSLAMQLEKAGADVIQTEGGMPMRPSAAGIQGLIEKAAPTLAATAAIAGAVEIPTMAASGISAVTAPLALASGAAGVGVGSAVNKLNSEVAMLAAVRQVQEAMAKELSRVRA